MKFGFEKEYFLTRKDSPEFCEVPTSLPMDECGYLAECRGPAADDLLTAAYLFLCEQDKLIDRAAQLGYQLDLFTNTTRLPAKFRQEVMRAHGKDCYPATRYNLYGKDIGPNDKWDRAGLHVHFSAQKEVVTERCKECGTPKSRMVVAGSLNIPLIVRVLDERYADLIKSCRRLPGWYELKDHGFEYRSLPAHFPNDVIDVAKFLGPLTSKMAW